MTKFFKHAFLAVMALCMTVVYTGCDKASVQQILNNVASTMLTGGQINSYSGKATSLALTGSVANGVWNAINGRSANTIPSVTAKLQKGANGIGKVDISAFTDGKVTVNAISITALTLTSTNDQASTTISVGDNSSITGSIVIDDYVYNAANLYIVSAAATSSALTLQMTIYFASSEDGNDYSKAINFTYSGTLNSTNK